MSYKSPFLSPRTDFKSCVDKDWVDFNHPATAPKLTVAKLQVVKLKRQQVETNLCGETSLGRSREFYFIWGCFPRVRVVLFILKGFERFLDVLSEF